MQKSNARKQAARGRAAAAAKDEQAERRRELARRVRLTKQISALTRQLQREIGKADRSLRELSTFVLERDGDLDAAEFVKIRELLRVTRQLRDGEDTYAAVQRLASRADIAESVDAIANDPRLELASTR